MGRTTFSFLLAVAIMASNWSQPLLGLADELDDVLGGFEDTALPVEQELLDEELSGFSDDLDLVGQAEKKASIGSSGLPLWLDLSGGLTLATSYNFSHSAPDQGQTDQRGFSRLRSSLDLTADLKLPGSWQARLAGKGAYDAVYSLRGRGNYSQEVLDQYEQEAEFTEVYLQGSLAPNLDLKIGRQVVVWGKSDNIRVTDILNPLDNREPGLVDIKDLRLPVSMSKVDYYMGEWNLSALLIHEVRFSKTPVYGNDFFPGLSPLPSEEIPDASLGDQYGLALNGIFSGWDLSLYGARIFQDQAYLENTTQGPRLQHDRITMLGAATNVAIGNWLFKGEAAFLDGLHYSIDLGDKQRLDLLVGAEYTGFSETVLSMEMVNRRILDFDDRLRQSPVYGQEDEFQYVLRLNKDFKNDTLHLTGLVSMFGLGGEDGAFQRLSLKYDWSDALSSTMGLITYQNGEMAMFHNISDNDRLFCELRYSF